MLVLKNYFINLLYKMSDKNETKYVSILDNDISNKNEHQQLNINDFHTLLKNFIKHKNNYEKLVKEGGLNRELNLKYRKELSEYEELIKSSFEALKLRKNKYIVDNYTIELYIREIREPLTEETLGKYFYKFYYCTRILNDKKRKKKRKEMPTI